MRIGELSQRSGVPATALRYYERAGLLDPPHRTASGYRAYGDVALERLAFIRAAQGVGLTLAEIRDIIAIREGGTAPCRHVVALLDERRAEVRSRIAELERLELELARIATEGRCVDPADCDPADVCSIIPVRGRRPPRTS